MDFIVFLCAYASVLVGLLMLSLFEAEHDPCDDFRITDRPMESGLESGRVHDLFQPLC